MNRRIAALWGVLAIVLSTLAGAAHSTNDMLSANAATLQSLEPVLIFYNDVVGNRLPKTSCPEIERKGRS